MKAWLKRWIFSLQFGIILFVLIAVYITFGTLIPQDLPPSFYPENFFLGNLIVVMGFHNTYSSWIFRVIMVLFLINLSGCTLKQLPSQRRRFKQDYFPSPKPDMENLWPLQSDIRQIITALSKKFQIITVSQEPDHYCAVRHRIGIFGSSVTHLGILIIVLGSFVGNHFAQEGFFNLLPGETATFHQEGFAVRLDDFFMTFREDGTTEQYYSDLTIIENGHPLTNSRIWVNRPLRHQGMMLYQSSFGWASRLQIHEIATNELVHNELLRNEQTTFFQPAHLSIHLFGYFPDFQMRQDGMPITMTQEERNPHYAVILYHFGEFVDSFIMNPAQTFTYQGYEISFSESILYTGIIYRKDYGYYYFLLGSLLLLAGLLLSFYFYPKYIWIKNNELYAISRQNSWGFTLWVRRYLNDKIGKEDCANGSD